MRFPVKSIINDLSTTHFTDTELAQKALVSLAIEISILDLDGRTLLDKVTGILYKKHKAYLPDCFEHPEYLNEALRSLYGDGYKVVVEKINKQLEEFAYQKQISEFLEKIAA